MTVDALISGEPGMKMKGKSKSSRKHFPAGRHVIPHTAAGSKPRMGPSSKRHLTKL